MRDARLSVTKGGLVMIFWIMFLDSHACKCPTISIKREAGSAYDVIIGKVISENEEILSCNEYGTDHSFIVEVEFSFRERLRDKAKVFGGVLHKGCDYLLVVKRCDDGLYTTMCSDNAFLSDARDQIQFLNEHFNKDYRNYRIGFLSETLITLAVIISGAVLMTFHFYKKDLKPGIGPYGAVRSSALKGRHL